MEFLNVRLGDLDRGLQILRYPLFSLNKFRITHRKFVDLYLVEFARIALDSFVAAGLYTFESTPNDSFYSLDICRAPAATKLSNAIRANSTR